MNEIEAVGAEVSGEPGVVTPGMDGEARAGTSERASGERPWIYGLMVAPSAVLANGLVQGGVLGYLLSRQGVGSGGQSHMIFLLALPTSLYFLWSPVTDFFVRRRSWLLAGGLAAAALMGLAFQQKNLSGRMAMGLMLVAACCVQLVVSSCGGMMGTMSSEGVKMKASSFYQAGSMGFGALTAWVLVWLSSRVAQGTLGWVAAALIGLPALASLLAPAQPEISTGTVGATARRVGGEFKATFWRWAALPYIAILLFPGGSGSAVGLLPGIAQQYGVSGDNVAWINGLLGGLLVAAGSGVMALVKVRMRTTVLYMAVMLLNCVPLYLMMLGPQRPWVYLVGVLGYLFSVGCCYAMFTTVVLEFLGDSGKSGSGRYSIINSMGNVPVLYMALVDGWGGDKWGGRGLAGVEGVVGGLGAMVLLVYLLTWGRKIGARVGQG